MWEGGCVRSSCSWKSSLACTAEQVWGNQILGAFEDAVIHLWIIFPAPHLLRSAVLGHVICHWSPPISTLNAITTIRTMPSSARGGLASAIKLKFRFWLITGEECDSEGNAYSLTHANGCYNQPATSPPVWEPGLPCHSDLRVFAGLFHNITEVWQLSNRERF